MHPTLDECSSRARLAASVPIDVHATAGSHPCAVCRAHAADRLPSLAHGADGRRRGAAVRARVCSAHDGGEPEIRPGRCWSCRLRSSRSAIGRVGGLFAACIALGLFVVQHEARGLTGLDSALRRRRVLPARQGSWATTRNAAARPAVCCARRSPAIATSSGACRRSCTRPSTAPTGPGDTSARASRRHSGTPSRNGWQIQPFGSRACIPTTATRRWPRRSAAT